MAFDLDHAIEKAVSDAYGDYDSDPRVAGPEDYDAFKDAVAKAMRAACAERDAEIIAALRDDLGSLHCANEISCEAYDAAVAKGDLEHARDIQGYIDAINTSIESTRSLIARMSPGDKGPKGSSERG